MRSIVALEVFFISVLEMILLVTPNQDSSRLFEELLSKYNKLIRPSQTPSEAIEIQFKFKLLQILDVHEKHQVLTTSGTLIHRWNDVRLSWEPSAYGNVSMLHIPGELIWFPVNTRTIINNLIALFYDIILYNNAHGSPAIAAVTKADVFHNGDIYWEPPVIYNSMCPINIKWFPYGSWTYGGFELDMNHLDTDVIEHISFENGTTEWRVELGVDISQYQDSVEFDLLSVVGVRHEKRYPCCDYPVIDIIYYLNIRRKKLFYTINLMVPCVGIGALTSFVFYLPSESHNKITLCINILVALTVFFLLLIEIVPPTSIVTPLIGKYLIFTMVMVTASITITVIVQNIHYRSPSTPIPKLIRHIFIKILGKYILIYRRPCSPLPKRKKFKRIPSLNALEKLENHFKKIEQDNLEEMSLTDDENSDKFSQEGPAKIINLPSVLIRKIQRVGQNIRYIEKTVRKIRRDEDLKADWMFVAMVLDRLMLIFFSLTILAGTVYTTYTALGLSDDRSPITYEPNKAQTHHSHQN